MKKALLTLLAAVYKRISLIHPLYRSIRTPVSKAILKRRVASQVRRRERVRIVIGANKKFQAGWIPTEVYTLNILNPQDWDRCYAEDSVDAMLAEHVWEHLTKEQGAEAARLCRTYLKPGGHLRVAVPDGYFPHPEYIEFVKPDGTGPSADDHKELYTYKTFREIFERAGFHVSLLEYFDEAGQFHYHEWDPNEGKVIRSQRFYDGHQFGGISYRSLILDAVK